MTGPKVLMVHEPTTGMHHDAVVLGNALCSVQPDLQVYSLDVPWNSNLDYDSPLPIPPEIEAAAPFDALFLFEHLYGHPPLRSPRFARRRIFVPNVEWVLPADESEILVRKPDAILYKNSFSRDLCERIPGFRDVSIRALTGWTSCDFRHGGRAAAEKDFRSFLHVKGFSDQKQTSLVLRAWLENPDFPKLTIIATMHDGFFIPVTLRAADNVEIIFRKIPVDELRAYQEACGVHIYPSRMEGFGHSLNEARVCESVLVATDGPPMNGFVEPQRTGFLVPVQQADISPVRRSMSYEVRHDALVETIRRILAMPVADLREIGMRSRQAYLMDHESFNSKVGELFGRSGALAIGRPAIAAPTPALIETDASMFSCPRRA